MSDHVHHACDTHAYRRAYAYTSVKPPHVDRLCTTARMDGCMSVPSARRGRPVGPPTVEQRLGSLGGAPLRRAHERRVSVDVAKVWIRPGFQESGDDLMSIVDRGARQGTLPVHPFFHSPRLHELLFTRFIHYIIRVFLFAVVDVRGRRFAARCLKQSGHTRRLILRSRRCGGGERWKRDE